MKKACAITVLSVMVILLSALAIEAGEWWTDYPYSPDYSQVVDRFSWDWYHHLAVTWNGTMATASAIEMDPDGIPVAYYWADVYPTYYDLYYSFDGFNWYYYGPFVY